MSQTIIYPGLPTPVLTDWAVFTNAPLGKNPLTNGFLAPEQRIPFIVGKVSEHTRFADDAYIGIGAVAELSPDGKIATTLGGNQYVLGRTEDREQKIADLRSLIEIAPAKQIIPPNLWPSARVEAQQIAPLQKGSQAGAHPAP